MIRFHVYGCQGLGGENTSSYAIELDNEVLLLDAGKGLIAAADLVFNNKDKKSYMFLSHTHVDHIEGLVNSRISFNSEDNKVEMFGPENFEEDLKQYFGKNLLPIDFEFLSGYSKKKEVKGGIEFKIGENITVKTFSGYHPRKGMGGSLAYKFEISDNSKKKVVTYATDMEFDYIFSEGKSKEMRGSEELKERYTDFIRGSDLLVADAQFTLEEYVNDGKGFDIKGWGHSYIEQIVDMAEEAEVKRLCITHHDPARDKHFFEKYFMKLNSKKRNIEIVTFAKKGDIIEI